MRLARPMFAVAAILATALPAFSAMPDYLDDRSTPQSLVKSFYNAVDRQEYARAYTYFADGAPLPYPAFAQGYADTASVSVLTGKAESDGAAGSTYFNLPVAIDAVSKTGTHKQFAGCYTLRLVQPAIQDPPVKPMFIDKATLKPAHGALKDILPKCPS
jgi:hypothetical protein